MSQNYTLSQPVSTNDHLQGNSNAPIQLVEYGDFQCSYCGRAYPIVKQLQKDFGDQLSFVFRNFPLAQIHEHAMHAAEAAELAAEQGKFWEMHDALYENQAKLDDLSLAARAEKLGMDVKTFILELEGGKEEAKVKTDFMSGVESGVNGTPSFFINGEKYNGSWDYEAFKKVLASVLNR